MALNFIDRYVSQVNTNYTSGGTTLVVVSASGLPSGACNFYLIVRGDGANAEEVFKVTNVSGTTLTVVGAQAGTSAQNHSANAIVTGSIMPAAAFTQLMIDVIASLAAPSDATKYLDGTLNWSTPAGGGGGGDLTKIAQHVISTPAATVTFSSIPGSYSQLMLIVSAGCAASSGKDLYMQYNGDTAGNYTRQYLGAYSGGPFNGQDVSVSSPGIGGLPGTSELSGSATKIVIANYAGTIFKKFAVSHSTYMSGGSSSAGLIQEVMIGHFWNSTASISSIVLGTSDGSNFVAGSTFTLYGLS